MKKTVMAAASYYKQAYAMADGFSSLPAAVKSEIRVMCVTMAEKLRCVFSVGFGADGRVFFETIADGSGGYDELGAGLEIARLESEKAELISQLTLWYKVKPDGNIR
ncbi:MAG: DUF6145 family protein [Clostridiales bacterium]|jgi:hypothetical protein|nr:DUF6145 family protein [Clostridiales bacterium]